MRVVKGERPVGGAGRSVFWSICDVRGLLLLDGRAEWGWDLQAWW